MPIFNIKIRNKNIVQMRIPEDVQPAISIFVSQNILLIIADFHHVFVQNLLKTLQAKKKVLN